MTAKKETKEKKIVKPAAITKKVKKQSKTQILAVDAAEQQFFAADLADKMGIGSYDFFLIKREAGIEDGSPITRSKMQELYDKIIKR